MKSIRTSEIAVWLKEVASDYGSSTARSALIVLNGCLELANADDLIRKNPARSKQVKRPPVVLNRSSVWPDEVVAAIIARHPPRYRLIPMSALVEASAKANCSVSRRATSTSIEA